LVDRLLDVRQPSQSVHCEIDSAAADKLDRHQARDLLLLAACYDQSTAETFKGRWHRLRRRLKYNTLLSFWPLALGWAWLVLFLILLICLWRADIKWLIPPWWASIPLALAG